MSMTVGPLNKFDVAIFTKWPTYRKISAKEKCVYGIGMSTIL